MIEQVSFPLAIAATNSGNAGIIAFILLACLFLLFLFINRRQPQKELEPVENT